MADSDGDAEWSEGSDIEDKQEEQVVGTDMDSILRRQRIKHQSQNPKSRSKSCPVPVRPYKAIQPLQPSYDTTDLIMDRIDAGIYSLTGPLPAAPTKTKKKRPSKAERSHLRDQGVEFDTGDETAGEIKAALKAQVEKERSTDTGVSTASVQEDFLSSVENTPRQIVGKVDTYSEHDLDSDDELKEKKHTDQLSDLDSDTAQQIEEKFIQILKKKRGGYLRDLKVAKQRPSDLESIRTEDFEEKIKQCLPVKKDLRQALPAKPKAKTRGIRECDLDSVLTEDIAMEFMKTMPKEMINPRKSPSRTPKQPAGRRLHPVPMSDADSIQTEDYENQFHTMMVKQVAKVPITNFDQMLVDSDLDTVRSQMIHDRIHSVTQRDYPDSIQSSELEEAKVEAIIERKLHEFFAKRGGKQIPEQTSTLPVTNSLPPSRSAHSLYTDTEDDEEEEEERNSIIRTSSPTRHSPARYRFDRRAARGFDPPPPLWEDPKNPQVSRPKSNQSSTSTFEEVESLEFSKSSSLELSKSSSTEFPQNNSSLQSSSVMDGSKEWYPGPSRRQPHRQVSVDRVSVGTSQSGSGSLSTFDEVESLDLGGHHALDMEHAFSDSSRHSHSRTSLDKSAHEESRKRFFQRGKSRDLVVSEDSDELPFAAMSFSRKQQEADLLADVEPRSGKSGRSIYDQLMEYKQHSRAVSRPSTSESMSSSYSSTSVSDVPGRYPFESEYEYYVRMRRASRSSGTSLSNMSRQISLDSSSSFNSSSPSSEQFIYQNATAEDILMNLGFGGRDSFLPERFAKDWFDKIMKSRTEKLQELHQQDFAEINEMYELLNQETPGSSQVSGTTTPQRSNTMESVHHFEKNSRRKLNSRRSHFKRAATILTYHQDHELENSKQSHSVKDSQNLFMEKQDSLDQLRHVLQKQASLLQISNDALKDRRRRQFASARQKSLPLCLETLNEEEEGKISKSNVKKNPGLAAIRERNLSSASSRELESPKSSKQCSVSSSVPATNSGSTSIDCSDIEADHEVQNISELPQPKINVDGTLADAENKVHSRETPVSETSTETSDGGMIICKSPVDALLSNTVVPEIVINVSKPVSLKSQSSSSLEVAEIMERTSAVRKKDLLNNVVPALLSHVLSDVEDAESPVIKQGIQVGSNSLLLCPPMHSPRLFLEGSPTPVSPITVIEVDQLDNQNDILDDEGINEKPASQDPKHSLCTKQVPAGSNQAAYESDPGSDVSKEDVHSPALSMIANDGSVHAIHEDEDESQKQDNMEEYETNLAVDQNAEIHKHLEPNYATVENGESAYDSASDCRSKVSPRLTPEVVEMAIQKDDGAFSPLFFWPRSSDFFATDPPLEEADMVLVMDQGVQFEADLCPEPKYCFTSVDVQTEPHLKQDAETQTYPVGNLSLSGSSHEDFDPVYLMNSMVQTSKMLSASKHCQTENFCLSGMTGHNFCETPNKTVFNYNAPHKTERNLFPVKLNIHKNKNKFNQNFPFEQMEHTSESLEHGNINEYTGKDLPKENPFINERENRNREKAKKYASNPILNSTLQRLAERMKKIKQRNVRNSLEFVQAGHSVLDNMFPVQNGFCDNQQDHWPQEKRFFARSGTFTRNHSRDRKKDWNRNLAGTEHESCSSSSAVSQRRRNSLHRQQQLQSSDQNYLSLRENSPIQEFLQSLDDLKFLANSEGTPYSSKICSDMKRTSISDTDQALDAEVEAFSSGMSDMSHLNLDKTELEANISCLEDFEKFLEKLTNQNSVKIEGVPNASPVHRSKEPDEKCASPVIKSSSTEKDLLAASIVTDFFAPVQNAMLMSREPQILSQIAKDYNFASSYSGDSIDQRCSPGDNNQTRWDFPYSCEHTRKQFFTVQDGHRFGAENTPEETEDPGKASDLVRQSSPTRSWHSANNSITASPNASFLGDMSRASNDTVIENQDVGSPDEVQKVVQQKKSALRELKSLHDTLKQNKEDIRQTERQIKDNRMKAEEARTQLMLAEFKRDSANKELEHLTAEISRRREELNEVEESIDRAHDKATEEEEKKISLNKEEIVKMTLERDELKAKLRSKETMEVEKQELEHQLISTKENFLTEQKRHRKRIEEMQEEMDSKQHKMDELLGEKDGLEKRINKLENKHRQMEQEKNEIIKEKTKEYQGVKERLQKELQETRTIHSKEVQELRQQLKETADQLASIQTKADSQEDANSSLKDKVSILERELKENVSRLENLQEEKQTTIKNLMAEKEDELNHLKRALEEEKVTELEQNRERLLNQLDQLREAHEREKQEILFQSQQAVQQEAAQLQSVISAKELEVEVLKDRISQQEESSRLLSDKLKQETMDQVRNALRAEREQWQADKEAEITHQLDSQRQELQRNMVRLREELDTERHISEQQLQQITALKQELEEARQQQREAYRERIVALNQTKELAKEEKEREIAILKNKIEQESNRELARLKESSGRQDEELKRLREEKQELIHREKESVAMLERQEKTLVYEINDECRKIANMLGVEAKIINVSGYGSGKNTFTSPAWSKSQLLAATSAAVSNLRECTNEMRRHYDQVGREVQGMKQKIRDLDQRKREELEAQREKMQNEKMRAMEQLKERLIQEHLQEIDKLRDSLGRGKNLHKSLREKDKELKEIQQNMKGWKDETVEKISKKFQDEMNREIEKRSKDMKQQKRELERRNASQQREIERLQREVNRLSVSKSTPAALNTPSTPTRRAPSPLPTTRRALSPSRHLSQSFTEGEGGSDTVKLLNHLQGRVKQLHAENISLKRGTSTPNLAETSLDTVPVSERQNKLMQQQMELANTKVRLAEDRAQKQEGLLNQKMVELSKLQGTLTHQTKELMQLERAYSQLQQHANRIATRATAR